MESNISLFDVVKILIKKIKLIAVLTIIFTAAGMCMYLFIKTFEAPVIYNAKIYGIIADRDTSENNLDNIIATVNNIYNSNAIKLSLNDMDFKMISSSSFAQGHDVLNLSLGDKTDIADKIFKEYEISIDENSKMFTLNLKGNNKAAIEYILNYIFNKGAQYTKEFINNTQIELIDRDIITINNYQLIYSAGNIIKNTAKFGAAGFFIICVVYLFIIILSDKVLSVSQIRKRYNIEILTILNKKYNIEELKSVLLYKLGKFNKNTLIFYSSYDNDNLDIILGLKNLFKQSGKSAAVVIAADDTNKFKNLSDVYFYINSNENKNDEFFNNLAKYDYIFIHADSILTSVITEKIISRYKDIVLIEKTDKSKFEEIDRTIEKTMLYDEKYWGL
jgi:capsular polysaccharide biosynthesis protein